MAERAGTSLAKFHGARAKNDLSVIAHFLPAVKHQVTFHKSNLIPALIAIHHGCSKTSNIFSTHVHIAVNKGYGDDYFPNDSGPDPF